MSISLDSETDPIRGFAELTILTLRSNGISDRDILTKFTTPNHRADARMEAQQLQETGTIYAPARAVKQAIRALLSTPATALLTVA